MAVERINATSLMVINDPQLRIYKGEISGSIKVPNRSTSSINKLAVVHLMPCR